MGKVKISAEEYKALITSQTKIDLFLDYVQINKYVTTTEMLEFFGRIPKERSMEDANE